MLYCGNNRNHSGLVNGTHVLGTRYSCLKRGIGKGMNMPLDNEFKREYDPIDETKIYCGDQKTLPQGYDRLGKLGECFAKGIGVGKSLKARRDEEKEEKKNEFKEELWELFNIHKIEYF